MGRGAPHRESEAAFEAARGWRDGKARDMAALDAWTDSDAFNPTTYQPVGNNPVTPYVEGFYAAVTGKPTEIRQRGDERMMGVAKAVDEIESVIAPDRHAETRAFVEADNARVAAERDAPDTDLLGGAAQRTPQRDRAETLARAAFPRRPAPQEHFVRGYMAELGDAQAREALIGSDAEADGADWQEVARIVLHRDPVTETERTRTCWQSHLARAQWMTGVGYRKILEQAAAEARSTRH